MKKGIYTALITPFKNGGKIDFESLSKIIKIQIKSKVSGVVALGTTAESPTLSCEEKNNLLDFIIQQINNKIEVVAGCGTNCTTTTLEQIKWLNTKKIDAILLSLPCYNKPNENGLKEHIKQCCKASSHPIILYYIPSRTGQTLSNTLLKKICQNKKIVALKEASGNLDTFFAATTFKTNFMVFSGNDNQFYSSLLLGGSGIISVASNVIPKTMVKIFNDCNKKLFLKNLPILNIMFAETNPVPIKYIMSKRDSVMILFACLLDNLKKKRKSKLIK